MDNIVDNCPFFYAPIGICAVGVANGKLYSRVILNKAAPLWEGRAITLGHTESIQDKIIGRVRNARLEGNVLIGDAYFDIAKCERLDPRIMNRLRANAPIQVSGSDDIEQEPAPEGFTFNAVPCEYIVSDIKPRYVALILDELAAFSLADGVGVNIPGA